MSILIVTGIEGARNCAAVVAEQLNVAVEVAEGRKTALAVLRKQEFGVIVLDETLAQCDSAAADCTGFFEFGNADRLSGFGQYERRRGMAFRKPSNGHYLSYGRPGK